MDPPPFFLLARRSSQKGGPLVSLFVPLPSDGPIFF